MRKCKVRRWTDTAVECFKRGCICNGCTLNGFFSGEVPCQMKFIVIELIKVLGIPENVETKGVLKENV